MFHIGFHFREVMSGSYHLFASPTEEHPVSCEIDACSDSLLGFVREPTVTIGGQIDLAGFARRAPLSGLLAIRLPGQRRLVYDFVFQADDAKTYSFRGERDVMLISLIDTITTLPASLYDAEGNEMGRCVLRWDLRGDLIRFLRSFRIVLRPKEGKSRWSA